MHKLIKAYSRARNSSYQTCLKGMLDDQYFVSYEESSVWQKTVDRGGLCKLSDHGLELALRDAHTNY